MFLSLEGGEGSGKSTQAALLRQWLERQCIEAVMVREPGTTRLGEELRGLLVGPAEGTVPISPWAEALMYTAARAELVREVIAPALAAGMWVVADRYIDSTLAYQGYGLGLPVDELRRINMAATVGLWPDLTILFDVRAETGLERSNGGARPQDRIEVRGVGFHRSVNEGYRQLAAADAARWRVIPPGLDVTETHNQVVEILKKYVGEVRS